MYTYCEKYFQQEIPVSKHCSCESDLCAIFSCISEFTQSMNWTLCVEIKPSFNLAFSTIIGYNIPSRDMSKNWLGLIHL